MTLFETHNGALFSECRAYRYALWRLWDAADLGCVLFVGLNPSTADETEDDPTIRRCIRFARDWGYGGIYVCNLFAFRATEPKRMKAASDPIGPINDGLIFRYSRYCAMKIAAWGNAGMFMNRDLAVQRPWILSKPLHCLGTNKNGTPKHPLYLPATSKPQLYGVSNV